MSNKKILNATPLVYNGIKFKSKFEVKCYKILHEQGFNPLYEEKHYTIFRGFTPTVPFYTNNTFKRKNCKINVISQSTVVDNRNIQSWIYTPDIYFKYGKYIINIEIKGFSNDVVRYKRKLFRWQLERVQEKDKEHIYEFWEVHTKKQLMDCINHIKNNNEENK